MTKVKGDEYFRIHRAVSNITPLAFWENIDIRTFKMKTDFTLLMPEEFRNDCDELAAITEKQHTDLLNHYMNIIKNLPEFDISTNDGKKARFQYISSSYPNDWGAIMGLLNNPDDIRTRDAIHRSVRPTGNRYEGIVVSQSLERFLKIDTDD